MNEPIAIGFVIYQPPDSFIQRVNIALHLGCSIYVFDNSPTDPKVRNAFYLNAQVNYVTSGKNVGLGFGMSQVCAQAWYTGCTALIFFDQDTVFTEETLRYIFAWKSNNEIKSGPYSCITFCATAENGSALDFQGKIRDVLLTINSGSLLFLSKLKQIGWFCEKLFVDCVDYDFCLRSYNSGYRVGQCRNTPGLDHISEQADSIYLLLGKQLRLRKYSARRIRGALVADIAIILAAFASLNWKFVLAMTRSTLIYMTWQIIVRLPFVRKSDRSLSPNQETTKL